MRLSVRFAAALAALLLPLAANAAVRMQFAHFAPLANTPYAAALEKMKAFMLANAARGLPAERIGEAVKTALTTPKPRTRYTLAPNPFQQLLTRALPKRVVDRMIGGRIGLTPPAR